MTFARFAKLGAVLLVAVAVWRAQTPPPSVQVAILALPAFAAQVVDGAGQAVFAGVVEYPSGASGLSFWRRLFAEETLQGREAANLLPLWSGGRASARVIAAPAHVFRSSARSFEKGDGFVGGSTGAFVRSEDLGAGRLPAPYDRVLATVSDAAAALAIGQWSDWIEVAALPPAAADPADLALAPSGEFQFVRLDEDEFFFSPAYQRLGESWAVSPFLRGVAREYRETLVGHVLSVSERRLAGVAASFEENGDRRPVLIFDTLGEEARSTFRPDSTPSTVEESLTQAVLEQLNVLREAVGPTGAVLVVGGPLTTRASGALAWFRVFAGDEAREVPRFAGAGQTDFASLRALVLYFSGMWLAPAETALVPVELVSTFPVPPSNRRGPGQDSAQAAKQGWSVATLGSVPGALGQGK